MFATLLAVGMTCWLAMFSPAKADPGDQTVTPPLFDNLGSLHHPITTTSEQAQRYFDQGLRLVYAFNHDECTRVSTRGREKLRCRRRQFGWFDWDGFSGRQGFVCQTNLSLTDDYTRRM